MRYYQQLLTKRPAVTSCFIAMSVAAFCYIYGYGLERFKPEAISDAIIALGYWGPMIYIILNGLRPLLFFPAIVLGVAGGLAYGPLLGSIYLVIGTLLGAVVCFALARCLGREKISRQLPKRLHFEKINAQLEVEGFKTLLLLRVVPVLPWDAISYLAGLTKIKFWPYFIATLLGSIPGAVAFCYLGNVLSRSMLTSLWGAVILVLVVSLLPQIVWRTGHRGQRDDY